MNQSKSKSKLESKLKPNSRVAIANRGEAAVRFIKAVKEFNILKNTTISTVAFFMDSDRDSLFVKKADLAIPLSGIEGYQDIKGNPYLNREFMLKAIIDSGCDGIWGGWGFLSEDHQFVQMIEEEALVFIGPTSQAMKLLGDKIAAKKVASDAKVPILPWSEGPIIDEQDAFNWGRRIGYPVILKAANGGGGRGIRFVRSEFEMAKAYNSVLAETKRITGNEIVFMEALVEEGRHLEVQVAADYFGNVNTYGVRDCSVQRNNQKIIEETPPANLDPRLMKLMEESSRELILLANYFGVATVEFIYDVRRSYPYFMEVNTRLQVEHPITEQIFGIDLVKMQLLIAMGERIGSDSSRSENGNVSRGVAIEVRLNAEDFEKNFAPSPGLISHLIPPAGVGIRVDSGVEQGSTISSEFDSMIAKIIAWSPERQETISRLISALDELEIKIEAGTTNRAFLKTLLLSEGFKSGGVNTSYVKNLLEQQSFEQKLSEQKCFEQQISTESIADSATLVLKRSDWNLALVVAAIYQYEERYYEAFSNFIRNFKRYSTPRNIFLENLNSITIPFRGRKYQFHIRRTPKSHYHLKIDNTTIVVRYFKMGPSATLFVNDRRKYVVQVVERNDFLQCEIDGIPYPIELDCQGVVRSHIPAMVLSTVAKVGDVVKKGDLLLILEAMKMEMPVVANQDGKISSMSVRLGEQVKAGQILFEIESKNGKGGGGEHAHVHVHDASASTSTSTSTSTSASVVSFNDLSIEKNFNRTDKEWEWEFLRREFLSIFSGHDYVDVTDLLEEYLKKYPEMQGEYVKLLWNGLKNFLTVEKLFSREKLLQKENARPFNYQEYLRHYFLREIDREKGLPEKFLKAIGEAIKLYSVHNANDANINSSSSGRGSGRGNKSEITRHALFRLYQSHAHLKEKERVVLYSLLKIKAFYSNNSTSNNQGKLEKQLDDQLFTYLAELVDLTRDDNPLLADTASHLLFSFKNLYSNSSILKMNADVDVDADAVNVGSKLSLNLKENNYQYLNYLIYSNQEIIFDLLAKSNNLRLIYKILSIRHTRDIYSSIVNNSFQVIELFQNHLISRVKIAEKSDNSSFDFYLAIVPSDVAKENEDYYLQIISSYHQFFSGISDNQKRHLLIYAQLNDLPREEAFVAVLEKHNWKLLLDRLTLIALLPNKQAVVYNYAVNKDDRYTQYLEPYKERLFNISLLSNFNLNFLKKNDSQYFFFLQAKLNKKDERCFAFLEFPSFDSDLSEKFILEVVHQIRLELARMKKRTLLNRIVICLSKTIDISEKEKFIEEVKKAFVQNKDQFSTDVIEQYTIYYTCGNQLKYVLSDDDTISLSASLPCNEKRELHISFAPEMNVVEQLFQNKKINPLTDYENKMAKSKQQGQIYPYELICKLGADNFEEWDLNKDGKLVLVKGRDFGMNSSNVVVGVISQQLASVRAGALAPACSNIMCKRVLIIGDPSRDYGSLAEGECRVIIAAIDLAEELGIPVEWIPFSSGARIDMKSGTENLDWTAAVLKRIINFTERGGEINLIVAGVNVGAQSYWNAEATMLMHTNGMLIMTEKGSMLLTGKKALEYSGSVSAEDNISIGGVEKIMGPNGESQFQVKDIDEAYQLLFNHYRLTYLVRPQKRPVRWQTSDPLDRNINEYVYDDFLGQGLKTIGDILGTELNSERKRPFDIRQVMKALIDQDAFYLERWGQMENAETAVSWQTRIGGHAVGLIGIESRPLKRLGEIPNDGPDLWTGGTLFPMSSKKVARSINAFSDRLPLVVLANLSGFDGSPESLRNHQLEFGAEIGRAVVNFQGPIIFVVISRYHGGAYVVFSKRLNKNMKVLALKNTFASVIGGGAAAAVVFPRMVTDRTLTNNRVKKAQKDLQAGKIDRTTYDQIYQEVEMNNQLQLAKEFDQIHSIERAKEVGSIDEIIESKDLRAKIIQLLSEYRD
ncbi:MAG: biotin/lipoyl-binding protein [Oligoflexia bacterium]|nr:biotin/lipoyl-binding protein [Oligoflexia bacterium]